MKTSVLFIQGAGRGAHEADASMVASLKDGLPALLQIYYPRMPHEERPRYHEWRERITQELAEREGDVVLVGHSLGGSTLLKYISEEPGIGPVAGLFIIAAPYWGTQGWQGDEYVLHDDFASMLGDELPLYFYHSRDDDCVPFEHLALYEQRIPRAIFRMFDDRGHQFELGLFEVAEDILNLTS